MSASTNACVRRRISANRYAARRFRKCSLIWGMARPQYNPSPRAWHLEVAMVLREDNVIETVTGDRSPHYEPFGWHHWPEHPWLSFQFRRGLGETQEGGGDTESWHREWQAVADRNFARGEDEAARGHVRTAMNCWLRAADYYRQAEFFLGAADPRRLVTFTKMERASHSFLAHLSPPGEVLEIPYEGASLYAYFVSAGTSAERQPCLISMGGLDRSRTRCGSCRRAARCREASPCS